MSELLSEAQLLGLQQPFTCDIIALDGPHSDHANLHTSQARGVVFAVDALSPIVVPPSSLFQEAPPCDVSPSFP